MNISKFGCLGLLSLPVCSFAQDTTNDSLKKHNLNEVVINAFKLEYKSPFVFTDLNKDEIVNKNDGKDLPYLLDQTPSVLVNSDAGNGVGYTDIRVRGTDGGRINLTINGIPINDAESQSVFFVNFPDVASSTSSIQVQRGVGSSTNGSGAFGASINISNINQLDEANATLTNSIGSFGTLRHTLTAGTGKLNGGFNVDLRLSKIKSNGYIDRSGSDLKSMQVITGWTSKNNRTNLKFNLFSGKEKTGQSWNGVAAADLKLNRTFNELGIKDDGSYFEDQTDNYQQDYYQLFLNHKFNQNWKLNTGLFLTRGKGFYNEYRSKEKYSSYYLANPIIGNDTITKTSLTRKLWLDNYYYGGIFNLRYLDNKSTLNIGGALTQYDGEHYGNVTWAQNGGIPEGYEWYRLPAHKTDFNLYVKGDREIVSNLYATIDLQVRSVNYTINGFRKNPEVIQNNNYLFFNPKAGLSYLKNKHKAFISFAIANKEPNRNDFESGVNDKPKAERLYDWELGYNYTTAKTNIMANAYYMSYKDQLILTGKVNDVGAYTRINVPKSYRAGVELLINHKIEKWLSINTNATFSQNKINSFTEFIDDYDNGGQMAIAHKNTNIALSPSLIAGVGFTFEPFSLSNNQILNFNLSGKYVGRQYLDNTSNNDRSIDPFALANFTVFYQTSFSKLKDIRIIGTINNVFNKMYESKGYTFSYLENGLQTYNYYFPQAGRNYNLTLQIGI